MTAALRPPPRDKVLEVGGGSGYQTAALAQVAPDGLVVTVERLLALAARAEATLQELDYRNVVALGGAGLSAGSGILTYRARAGCGRSTGRHRCCRVENTQSARA